MNDHPYDLLALHALGALDAAEFETVEAHAATCSACTRELGEAEAVVTALDDAAVDASGPLPPSPFARRPAARGRAPSSLAVLGLAASLLFGIGFGTSALVRPHAPARDSEALATVASAHFLHVSLAPSAAGVPAAKVLYARDGTWLYAIVNGPAAAYRFRVHDLFRGVRIDAFAGDAALGTLFESHLRKPPVGVDLIRASDGATVASATIVYPATSGR